MNIGDKIRDLRIKNNLKQSEVADMLFISEKTVSSWENNRTSPDIGMIYKLSNLFKVSFIYFVNEYKYSELNEEVCVRIKVDKELFDNIYNKNKEYFSGIIKLRQIDKYYNIDNNGFLRLRRENDKSILNYKKLENEMYSKRYHVEIDNYDDMNSILTHLGYDLYKTIYKNRISVIYKDLFVFNFDDIDNIGYFIEIKNLKRVDNYKELYLNMLNLLKELNIDSNLITNKKYTDY